MKWGLIGASSIASGHMIAAIREQQDNTIEWVVSSSIEHAEQYAQVHQIPTASTDLQAVLANAAVEAVYISSTNEKHFPQAMAAIKAGKHVLCEKPLAMTLDDAVTMVQAASAAGVVFATNHHLRNAGSHRKIKSLIDSGTIGDVLSLRVFHAVFLPEQLQGWRINDADSGGGVIPDIVVHDADTVRFYLSEDPLSVAAIEHSGSLGEGVEDSVMSIWTMPSGAMVQTHESFTHAYAGTGIEIHGSKGSIFAKDVNTQRPIGEVLLRTESGEQSIDFVSDNLYVRSVNCFVQAVQGTGQPAATGVDGIKSLAVATAVKQAATCGKHVTVDYKGY